MKHIAPPSFQSTRSPARFKLRILAWLFCALPFYPGSQAAENWMLSTPEPLPSPINLLNTFSGSPCLSADGRTLYFCSDRPGGYGKWDLWVATRSGRNHSWSEPVNLGPDVNTAAAEVMPSISADGLTLLFGDGNPFNWRARNGSPSNYQIWMTTRATPQSPWQPAVELPPPVGSSHLDDYPHLTADGLSLYFTSARPDSYGLNVAQRTSPTGPWTVVKNLGAAINSAGSWNAFPWLSTDGLRLIYQSDRSGGRGGFDLWMSTRTSTSAAWPAPINLGSLVNSGYYDVSPCVSADFPALGSELLFSRNDFNGWNSRFRILRSVVIPNITLLRSPSLNGPWNPIPASFVSVSADTIVAQSSDTSAPQSFYRLKLLSETTNVQILSAEKSNNTFKIQFQWSQGLLPQKTAD